MSALPERHVQEFEAELRRRGWSVDDFELSAESSVRLDGPTSEPSITRVSIRHRDSGTRRDYRYGQWLFDFVRDLDSGGFKRWTVLRDNPPQTLVVRA